MKTKLLKLALCAMAALPIGAWADSTLEINFAQIAVEKIEYGNTIEVLRNTSTSYSINDKKTYPYSSADCFAENDIFTSSRDLVLRYLSESNIGLYQSSSTVYGFRDLKANDVIEIAYKGKDSDAAPDITAYNCTNTVTTKNGYTFNFTHGTAKTLEYDVKKYTVSADGSASLTVAGAYFAYIKVTRLSRTACRINTSSFIAAGDNPTTPSSFASSSPFDQSGTWTNSGAFSFEISGGNVRNYNNSSYKIQEQMAILLQASKTYTITKSPNIKSVTMYIKQSDDNGGGTVYADYGEDSQTTLINAAMKKRSEDADEINISSYSNIRTTNAAILVFDIEYYASATLTVADINWASMYLPFAVNIPNEVTGVYYATAASSSSNVITLKKRETDLPKETGVLVNAPAGTYTFTAATEAPDALASTNLFLGSATDKTLDDEEAYVLAGSTNTKATPVFKLYSSGEGTIDLSAYKAYLPASSVESSARILNFVFEDDETTGLTEMKSNNNVKNSEAYNLVGQRVSTNTKGIVIINGRKYINK